MTVETASYPDELNTSWPADDDAVNHGPEEGAAHLRVIKSVIATTFPNVSGAITLTEAEANILDGATVTTAEINILDGVTATAAELNILDGVTATADELNILDGVTSTTAELNILDGVTATADEINTLDGITAKTAELNILDGVTADATDLNKLAGFSGTVASTSYVDTAVALDSYYTITEAIADVSSAETLYIPVPVAGTVVRVDSCLQAAINTSDATVTLVQSDDSAMASLTIAQSGSAAGDVDTDSSITNGTVTAGSYLKLATDGGSTGTAKLIVTITIQTDTV